MILMKKIITIILLSLISIYFVFNAYKNIITSQKNMCVKIETEELILKIEGQETFAVFFYQNNCISCKQVTSVLNEYIQKTGVNIYALDLSSASKPGFIASVIGIEESPVIIFYDEGEEVMRLRGVFSLEEIMQIGGDYFENEK